MRAPWAHHSTKTQVFRYTSGFLASVKRSCEMMQDMETDARVEAQCVLEGVGYAYVSGEAADVYFLYTGHFYVAIHHCCPLAALEDGILVLVKIFSFVEEAYEVWMLFEGLHELRPDGGSDRRLHAVRGPLPSEIGERGVANGMTVACHAYEGVI